MSELADIRSDLVAEQESLEAIVTPLDDSAWSMKTASPGWDVRDQIGHLTYFDGTAALAISDPDAFAEGMRALFDGAASIGYDEFTLGTARGLKSAELLEMWRMNRSRLDHVAVKLEESTRVVWYGPSMGAKSFLTARLMECWAHGQDIIDALHTTRVATDRLRHIARLGYNTRSWSYSVRGLSVPDVLVRVELVSPSGELWRFGNDEAKDVVTGTAEDFCLVVTQRRHVDDTNLTASGSGREWLLIAQAFAGGPTTGPDAQG